jgi:PRELI-like family
MIQDKFKTLYLYPRNLTFCNFVNMEEKMTYTPHPDDVTKVMYSTVPLYIYVT